MVVMELAKRITKLEAALDINTSVFSDTMKVLEIKMNVFEEVLSMLHEDGAGLVTDEKGKVDFGYYLKRYLEHLGAKEEKKDAPPSKPVLASPDDESPIIFGGDTTPAGRHTGVSVEGDGIELPEE